MHELKISMRKYRNYLECDYSNIATSLTHLCWSTEFENFNSDSRGTSRTTFSNLFIPYIYDIFLTLLQSYFAFVLLQIACKTPQQNPGSMGSEGSFAEVTGNNTMDAAEKRLNELGYKQELRREMVGYLFFAILFFMELILDPIFLKMN